MKQLRTANSVTHCARKIPLDTTNVPDPRHFGTDPDADPDAVKMKVKKKYV
jgi:hypothetical protein